MSAKNRPGSGPEIVITRNLSASPARVFGAFSDPAEQARVRDLVATANEQNFDRLETHLAG